VALNDRTLMDLARVRPMNVGTLQDTHGMGQRKCAAHGGRLCHRQLRQRIHSLTLRAYWDHEYGNDQGPASRWAPHLLAGYQ